MRIVIALLAMGVPTWALLAGYDSVFVRMQILTALLSGASVCLIFWLVVTLIYGRIYCSAICPAPMHVWSRNLSHVPLGSTLMR